MEILNMNNLTVGDTVVCQLMVFAASSLLTKTNKPYLAAKLGNKTGTIEARLWTLPPGFVLPKVGSVYTVNATVGEFANVKQLNIATMSPVETYDEADFTIEVPNRVSMAEFDKMIVGIREELTKDQSTLLFDVFDRILEIYSNTLLTATAACGVHHAGVGGWAKHTAEVVYFTEAIYSAMPNDAKEHIRRGLLFLGAFLHDIGKLKSYAFDTGVPVMTDSGKLLDHIVEGICIVHTAMHEVYAKASPEKAAIYEQQMRDVELLEHIIASHHTELEWGSPVNPVTLEAVIICHADQLSASIDTITTALKEATEPWTQKIFTQHNRQFTTSGVNDLG